MADLEPARSIVHSRFYTRTFGLVTAALCGYLLFRIVSPFIAQLIWGALLAALLHPLHRRFTLRLKNRPTASAAIISVGGALIFLVPIALLATIFTRQASQLITRVQAAASQRHIEGLSDLLALPQVRPWLERFTEASGVQPDQVVEWATTGAESSLQFLAATSGSIFVGALGAVGNFAFIVFFLFVLLRDGAKGVATVAHLIPMPGTRRAELFETLSSTASAVVLGTLLTAAVQGTLVSIGFAMAGLPSAIVFGVLAMLASPIPMVGTALVWLPAAVALFAQGRPGWGIFMLVWGVLVVSMVDNIMKPLIIGGRSGVPTLLVFVGVLGGLGAFGSVGVFIGPLILTLVVALIRYADDVLREREGLQAALVPVPVEPTPVVVPVPVVAAAPAQAAPAAPETVASRPPVAAK